MSARGASTRAVNPSRLSLIIMAVSFVGLLATIVYVVFDQGSVIHARKPSPLYVCEQCGTPNAFNNPKLNHPSRDEHNAGNFHPTITNLSGGQYRPIIETERLRLRPVTMNDLEDLHEGFRKAGSEQSSGWTRHKDLHETRDEIKDILKRYKEGDTAHWGIALKHNNKVIGLGGFTGMVPAHHRSVIGWWLNSDHWGRGYATEIGRALVEFGMKVFKLNRIEAHVKVHNVASQRVLAKVGMSYYATHRHYWEIKDQINDYHLFAVLKKDIESQLQRSII